MISKLFNGVWNEYCFYVAITEPKILYDFKPMRETQYFRILTKTYLFQRYLYV